MTPTDRHAPTADAANPRAPVLDDVACQIVWNRLISIVEEQAQVLVRTAFSTSVREAGDLSAGVYDAQGRMLAQAVTGTPGHVNSMAESVGHFIAQIGVGNMHEGDVFVTNDPWHGTGHLHDFTMVTPTFFAGIHVGYFACTVHVVDIGGRGFTADGASLYEEGLQVPIMPFARQGEVNADLIRIVRANVREPDQVVGDLHALAACNEIGQRRLRELFTEVGMADLEEISTFILLRSHEATVERIAAFGEVSAQNTMVVDGYDAPITLHATLSFWGDRVHVDFSGTSRLDRHGINVPLVYTRAYTCYALKCAIAPDIPNNAASLAPFEVSAPEGCILNARRPAAVALRHITGHMLPDTVLGALHKIRPGFVPTEGAGAICNFHLSIRPRVDDPPVDARHAEVLMFNSGGMGALPHDDGLSATAFPSGVMTMPIEVTEQAGPIVIWRKELRPDSGGAGRYRGGLGQDMEIGVLDGHEFDFSAMFDRLDHPANGRDGGHPGAPTRFSLDDGRALRGKGKQRIDPGHRVILALPGGGGYGDPRQRDRALVERDLRAGYISEGAAHDLYGLSVSADADH
ncbi:MAG: hydantoinase B/oxoprolinase family protein [Burkholderiaceae bacterium]